MSSILGLLLIIEMYQYSAGRIQSIVIKNTTSLELILITMLHQILLNFRYIKNTGMRMFIFFYRPGFISKYWKY